MKRRSFAVVLIAALGCGEAEPTAGSGVDLTPRPRVPLRHLPTGTSFAGIHLAAEGLSAAWQPGCELLPTPDCDRATARVDGDTVESWTTEREGAHHRFLLRDPRRGPLSLRLAVRGAKLKQIDADTVSLTTHGRTFHYAGLVARDETGTVLPTRMEAADEAIVLHVDATDSVGWIDVDPLLTEPDLEHQGTLRWGRFGSWLSAAGDNNADGYDDLVSDGNGNAYWLPGGPNGTTYSSEGFLRHQNATLRGYNAVGGWDVDGDGIDDVLQTVNQLGHQLALGVVGGTPQNQPLMLGRTVGTPSMVQMGDFNGDGLGDLVEFYQRTSGPIIATAITHGGPGVQTRPADLILSSMFPGSVTCVGWGVEPSVGDVNGDGYDDLLVNFYDQVAEGYASANAWLFLGSPTGLGAQAAWTWLPVDPSERVGDIRTVLIAGDLDGDGLDDIVAAGDSRVWWQPGADLNGEPRLIGAWRGWFIERANCASPLYGRQYDDYALFANGVGDVNGDGYDDLAVTNLDDAKVFLGGPDGPLRNPYWEVSYAEPTARHYTNRVGDLNGDGFDDLSIFSSWYWDEDPNEAGSAQFYWGRHFPDLDNDGSPNELDCDPYRDDIAPNLPELPGTDDDNDCDGEILCYVDLDHDGVPGTLEARPLGASCTDPGYFPEGGDCDDQDPTLSPLLPELPDNERDEDCDGYVACHVDRDGDGFGALEQLTVCAADPDWTLDDQDCDDTRPGVSPAATEITGSGFDDDCDGIAACFQDLDGDFAGIPGTLVWSTDASCEHPGMGYLVDCAEGNAAISPHLPELPGDNVDQDCDGQLACYEDLDGDGFGTSTVVVGPYAGCASPGVSNFATDCAPAEPTIYPTAVDLPANGIDEDCTGIDAGWADADGDGFAAVGAGTHEWAMTYLSPLTSADCDDTEDHVYPGAVEYFSNDVDEDCNGFLTCLTDVDDDGFGACLGSSGLTVRNPGIVLPTTVCGYYFASIEIPLDQRCGTFPGTSVDPGDCNDEDARQGPHALTDRPDNLLDDNCDRYVATFHDLDGDGYGTVLMFPTQSYLGETCPQAGCVYATRGNDCDDTNPSIHPDRPEVLGDAIDDNCNTSAAPRLTLLEGPGRRVRLVATDLPPNQAVRLDVSQTAPTSSTCPPTGPCALLSPTTSLTGATDALGELTFTYDLPPALNFGEAYWFHVLTPTAGLATEVVAWTDTPTLSVLNLGDRFIQIDAFGLPPNAQIMLDRSLSAPSSISCAPTTRCRQLRTGVTTVLGTTDAFGRHRWTFRVPFHIHPLTVVRFQVVAGFGPENATNVASFVIPYLGE